LSIDLSLPVVAPAEVGLDEPQLEQLDRRLHAHVDDGTIPGVVTVVSRHGRVAHLDVYGSMDIAAGKAMEADTIFRIYSMTKPVVSVALMMVYEEGRFRLDEPVETFVPELANRRVLVGGTAEKPELVPARRSITPRDLLTHTSGIIYPYEGFDSGVLGEIYRSIPVGGRQDHRTLQDFVEALGKAPLAFHPGERWIYGLSTDVCGHLVEVLSGQTLDVFLAERIFEPLEMVDTAFHVPPDKLDRLVVNYQSAEGGGLEVLDDPQSSPYGTPPTLFSGGAGLVSTAADYLRFCQALLDDGAGRSRKLLGRKTVELMTSNHLESDIASIATSGWALDYRGQGFGLGFAVCLDPAQMQRSGSVGEYNWGGAATTIFWIDPAEELIAVVLTQVMPSISDQLRPELMALVYAALD
jgi:CubicO group peptidase (beta-lactamase class C family)